MTRKQERPAAWRDLTWDDLDAWAGPRSLQRGRSYQRSGHVRNLARCEDGSLLAWVQGQQRYATRVKLNAGAEGPGLSSRCTCPLGISGCKHAVAIVVEYLDALKNGRDMPAAGPDDPRLVLFVDAGRDEEVADEFERAEDEEAWEESDEEPEPPRARAVAPARKQSPGKGQKAKDLRAYLEGLPAEELVSFVLRMAGNYPEVQRELADRAALASGKTGELVRQARKEITRLTAQEVWYDSWRGHGNLPEYSGLHSRFEQLLEHGQADALLELGELLFAGAQEQVESSDDEGETARAVGQCLDVVFRAVVDSGRPDAEKLLYVLDMLLRDNYSLCEGTDVVLNRKWPRNAWSAVADELARRLGEKPAGKSRNDFSERYRRDQVSDWLIESLEKAGRSAEVLPLLESEARLTGNYARLVERLIADRRLEDAKRWAAEGIERVGGEWAGVGQSLREHLRAVAELEKDWPVVAALRAEEFFHQPSTATLETLQKAADRAGCGPEVRAAALHFLETGVRPQPVAATAPATSRARRAAGKRAAAPEATGPAWPLPEPVAAPRPRAEGIAPPRGPYFQVLIDLAIREKRPDDVLSWYDRLTRDRHSRWETAYLDPQVADAVADSHPDRALAIYRRLIEAQIDRTSPSAYEAALPYLRKTRGLLHGLGRDAEWAEYLAQLREEHHRKRRLMEVLDRLESRRIVEG